MTNTKLDYLKNTLPMVDKKIETLTNFFKWLTKEKEHDDTSSYVRWLANEIADTFANIEILTSYREWLLDELAKEDANLYVEYLFENEYRVKE